jgi:hypothetical protein
MGRQDLSGAKAVEFAAIARQSFSSKSLARADVVVACPDSLTDDSNRTHPMATASVNRGRLD